MVSGRDYDACTLGEIGPTLDPNREYFPLFVGIDCGRVKDWTVVWTLERSPRPDSGGVYCYRTVAIAVLKRMPFDEQYEHIAPLLDHPDVTRGFIDQGAQGWALAERVGAHPKGVIRPFGFSAPRKAQMAERIRSFSQSHRIGFPDDRAVRASVLCVQKVEGEGGGIKYEGRTTEDHGDAFWACALALHAAEKDRAPTSIWANPNVPLAEIPALPALAMTA